MGQKLLSGFSVPLLPKPQYRTSKLVVVSEEIRQQVLPLGIRKLERQTGVCDHTIEKVLRGQRIRRKTLVAILTQVQESTKGRQPVIA